MIFYPLILSNNPFYPINIQLYSFFLCITVIVCSKALKQGTTLDGTLNIAILPH